MPNLSPDGLTLERLSRQKLAEHNDVSATAPNDADVLKWSAGSAVWQPAASAAPGPHTHPLSDITGYGAAGGYIRSDGAAWLRVSGVAWADLTGVPSTFAPSAHDLISATHTAAGLTTGHFLKATGATAFAFGAHGLTYTDVGAAAASHTHPASGVTSGTWGTGASYRLAWSEAAYGFRVKRSQDAADPAMNAWELVNSAETGVLFAVDWNADLTARRGTFSIATGTAPLTITSTTAVANLNADLLDGSHASAFALASHTHVKANITDTPWAWTDVSKTGSSLADLATRSAGDLSSGTLADARLSSNVPLKNTGPVAWTATGTRHTYAWDEGADCIQVTRAQNTVDPALYAFALYNSGQTAVLWSVDWSGAMTAASMVTSVSGTTNRITASPTTGAVVVNIASTYVGQTSITTLGVVGAGTWQGTIVVPTYGGTGANLSGTGGAGQYVKQISVGAAFTVGTIPWADVLKAGSSLADLATRAISDTTGTLADNRLTSNVPLKNAANVFSAEQSFSNITALARFYGSFSARLYIEYGSGLWRFSVIDQLGAAQGVTLAVASATGVWDFTAGKLTVGGTAVSLSGHTHVKANITDTPWAWADVSKTGSSLADLATRAISDTTGTLADNRLTTNVPLKNTGVVAWTSTGTRHTYAWDEGAACIKITRAQNTLDPGFNAIEYLNTTGGVLFGVSWTGALTGSGYVSSVSGTTNRITASPTTGAVVVDISASYVGQASITTLGAVTAGSIGGSFGAINIGASALSAGPTSLNGNLTLSPVAAANRYIILDVSAVGTGALVIQAGFGSVGAGGSMTLYSHSHASRPGYISAGISSASGGKFTVMTQAIGNGSDVFTVDASGNVVSSGSLNIGANALTCGAIAASDSVSISHETGSHISFTDVTDGLAGYIGVAAHIMPGSVDYLGIRGQSGLQFTADAGASIALTITGANAAAFASTVSMGALTATTGTFSGQLALTNTAALASFYGASSARLNVTYSAGSWQFNPLTEAGGDPGGLLMVTSATGVWNFEANKLTVGGAGVPTISATQDWTARQDWNISGVANIAHLLYGPNADAGNTEKHSPMLQFRNKYWDTGTSASVNRDVYLGGRVTAAGGYFLRVLDNASAEKITFDLANVRVGIGNTVPSYALDVNGSCRAGFFRSGGDQVVGPRGAAVTSLLGLLADLTYGADERDTINNHETVIGEIVSRLQTHGLIA